jgi:MFS family permease
MHTDKKHNALFYGWWIVASGFMISFLTGGTVFFGFTAILEPLVKEFGWSYTQVSLAASLRGLEMGLLAPIVGLIVDRWGPRILIFGGAVSIGLGLLLLSHVNSLAMFYGSFILIAVGMSTLSGTVTLTAVANWFRKKAAIATGIVVSGTAVGGVLVPVVSLLIDKYEWRTAMIVLAICIVAIIIPLSLVFRHKPERYGYLPDGETTSSELADKNLIELPDANRDDRDNDTTNARVFWHMSLASFCHMVITSAVVTHIMPYLSSTGIARSAASLAAGVLPLASIGGRLGSGWFGDRFEKKKIAAVGFALVACGLLFFGFLSGGERLLLLPFIVLFSTGWGTSVTIRAALLREYYSRNRFGRMYGFLAGIAMLGTVAGAPLAGWVYDRWDTYQGIWFVFTAVAVLAVIIILTIPPVKRITE